MRERWYQIGGHSENSEGVRAFNKPHEPELTAVRRYRTQEVAGLAAHAAA
jgi:hypothetical protein